MNKIYFLCKRSGNVVSFTLPGDIDGMRKHEGYVEIRTDDSPEPAAESQAPVNQPTLVAAQRRGRPAKKVI